MPKQTVSITIRVESADYDYISASATALKMSMTALVLKAVRQYVKNYKRFEDVNPED